MRKEDILAKCIDDIEAGKSTVEECMARHPELRDELQPLLEIAQRLQTPHVAPSAEFKQRARSRLFEAMRESPAPARHDRAAVPGWLKVLVVVGRPSFAVTAILILLILAAGGGGVVYASQTSLPDDTLYPVKKAVEKVQVGLTRSPGARAALRSVLVQRRVEEITAQASLGRSVSYPAVRAIPANIDAAIGDISGASPEQARSLLTRLAQATLNQEIKLSQVLAEVPERSHAQLKQAFDSVQRGNLIARVAYDNPAFLSSRPSVEDEQLEAAYFEVEGTLLSADNGNWNVGGVAITGVKLDTAPERPTVGSRVQIQGIVQKDGTFISRIDSHEAADDQVQVQGVLGGTSLDEKVWYVGGVPVTKPRDATPPPVGSSMKVAGTVDKDNLVVTSVKSEDDEDKFNVNVRGTLAGVNAGQNNIAIDVAGSKVTVDTSKASIESGDGKPLTISDLNSLVGKDVKVSRPYVAGGILHAQKVSVDVDHVARSSETDKGRHSDGGDDRPGSNVSPTPTPGATPTSAITPTLVPTPTQRHIEKSGEDSDQQTGEQERSYQPTPTPAATPTYLPTPAVFPTPTPRYTQKQGDSSDGDKDGSDLKPTPTLRPTPTPTPRYTDKTGDSSDGDKEGGDLKATPTPVPTPASRLVPTPTPTPRYTERTGDR